MKHLLFIIVLLPLFLNAQLDSTDLKLGNSTFFELGGKGFMSVNYDIPLGKHHRIGISFTSLDYEVLNENYTDSVEPYNWWSPGIMYFYLKGKDKHFFELGAGMSISPKPNRVYDSAVHSDSPFSFHGVVGWRYQKKNGWLFRAGFTPFYRPKVWFLPLIGLSVGYSW